MTAAGRIIPVSMTISPIRDAAGAVVGLSNIVRGLSETQNLNKELHQRGALLQSILDAIPDGLIVIDERGLVQFFSPSAERMFGYAAPDIVGQNVSVLMPAGYAAEHDSACALLRHRRAPHHRHRPRGHRATQGRLDFPMELQIGEARIPGTQWFAGFVRDLTEREDARPSAEPSCKRSSCMSRG